MNKPTVEQLALFMSATQTVTPALQECLDVAVEYVETHTGLLAERTDKTAMCREAIFIIGKHEFGVRQNPSAQSAQYANGDYTPGPAGYLVPNRAATLIDSLQWDFPDGVGIG